MMNHWIIILLVFSVSILGAAPQVIQIPLAYSQEVIDVNSTAPCFLNYTAGAEMWSNCGADDDYITFALQPWEYITGGHFSLVLVSVFILFTYIKYHKIVYPIITGILFLPVSYFVFPETFLSWGIVMAFLGIGILIWYTFIRQTKEY